MNYALIAVGAIAIFFVLRTPALRNFGGLAICVLIVVVLGSFWRESFEDRVARLTKVDPPAHEFTGCSASRRAVEARLKSPASAKWGDCRSTTSGGVQTVQLTVDSQNGFGAMLRSQWVATVRDNNVETVVQIK